jgi:hypothetical protein
MKTMNQLIGDYTCHLQLGEIQVAYKGIIDFLGKLRADFIKKYPHFDTSSLYQGYMDMSYFALSTELLKEKGLKIAIVYLHEQGVFEVWLAARNKQIAKRYEALLNSNMSNIAVFHDNNNQDAIIECILTTTPDFEDQALLTDIIELGTEKFVTAITRIL